MHCPRMLMWCSLLLLAAITAINVHAVHVNLLCMCLQTREIFKILDSYIGVTKYTHVMHSGASSLNELYHQGVRHLLKSRMLCLTSISKSRNQKPAEIRNPFHCKIYSVNYCTFHVILYYPN